jgi:hypothetical protein
MIIYNVRVSGALSTTTTPIATIISGATRSFLLLEVDLEGMGTASQANEVGIYRVGTAGITGSSALTFTAVDVPNMSGTTPALAFSGTGFAAYATQPIAGALVRNIPINANGQRYFWRANANLNNAIAVTGGNNALGSIGLFPINTAGGTVTGCLQLAEI